ncbi:hypothetical protein FB107DRAFT_265390 [Schizophyllum commune]
MLPSVITFNALPAPKSPTQWHFDLRYLPLEPKPYHILLVSRADGASSHIEKLPIGCPADRDGLEFFPDTPADAAPTVARALVELFSTKATLGKERPSRLMTPDTGLAAEVGKELRRIGVSARELHNVAKSTPAAISTSNRLFEPVWKQMLHEAKFHGVFATVLSMPEYINMSNIKLRAPERLMTEGPDVGHLTREQKEFLGILEYMKKWFEARPPSDKIDYSSVDIMAMNARRALAEYFPENSAEEVKDDADEGQAWAALDYALRLMTKPKNERNRQMIHKYLMTAIHPSDEDSTEEFLADIASTAHAILVHWCARAAENEIRSRYLFAACHHAEQALILAKKVSPADKYASPLVLVFLRDGFAPHLVPGSEHAVPALVMYKQCRVAYKMRNDQVRKEKKKMDAKRGKEPNRYRCANPGCGILAEAGKMLKQCAGKCDIDQKPHYCSKECQRADWKNHKEFCKPGIPRSSADVEAIDGPDIVGGGDFTIPIKGANGQTTYVSSSTMSPEELKEFRDVAMLRDLPGGTLPSFEKYYV